MRARGDAGESRLTSSEERPTQIRQTRRGVSEEAEGSSAQQAFLEVSIEDLVVKLETLGAEQRQDALLVPVKHA